MVDYEVLVAEIRASKSLGRGSCSWVDECLTDAELLAKLKELVEGDPKFPTLSRPMVSPTNAKVVRELARINRAVLARMRENESF